MPITIVDESQVAFTHIEDRVEAKWEAAKAAINAKRYGQELEQIALDHEVQIGAYWIHITLPTSVEPVSIAAAAARALRDNHDYRHVLPADWHVSYIREQYRSGNSDERIYEIALNSQSNPGPEYSEDIEALKKRVGI